MRKRILSIARNLAAVSAAGMLFQMGGCTLDGQMLVTDLVNTVATGLISSFVFGALGLSAA